MRVRVPFGRQQLVGVVHSHATSSELPKEKLKPVLEVIDAEPVIDAQVMRAARVGGAVLPPSVGLGDRRGASQTRARRRAVARAHRTLVRDRGGNRGARCPLKRAPRQRELLEALRRAEGVSSDALAEKFEDWRTPMRALVARGFASSAEAPEASIAGPGHRAAARHRTGAE